MHKLFYLILTSTLYEIGIMHPFYRLEAEVAGR